MGSLRNQDTGSEPAHRVMSASNPKPRDLNATVLVVDGDEMRLRRDDEATESGKEVEHTRFIVCTNVGVSDTRNIATWPYDR